MGKWCELAQRVLGEACLDVGKAAGAVCGRQESVHSIFISITSIESSFLLKGGEKIQMAVCLQEGFIAANSGVC